MEATIKNAVEITEYIIREYYQLNLQPILSILSKDVVWIGPGNLFVFGKEAFEEQFKHGFVMPIMHLENAEFYLQKTGKNSCIVFGRYSCSSSVKSEKIMAVNQRLTICYENKKDKLELVHMHVSNEWNELVDNEVFPVQVSTQTYQYVKKILKERLEEKEPKKVELKGGTANFFVDPFMVLYVETVGAKSMLHFLDKIIIAHHKIGIIENIFPDYFYRAHRSYLINVNYIMAIKRYFITMSNGQIIPIPEKRYNEVKRVLTEKMNLQND